MVLLLGNSNVAEGRTILDRVVADEVIKDELVVAVFVVLALANPKSNASYPTPTLSVSSTNSLDISRYQTQHLSPAPLWRRQMLRLLRCLHLNF